MLPTINLFKFNLILIGFIYIPGFKFTTGLFGLSLELFIISFRLSGIGFLVLSI